MSVPELAGQGNDESGVAQLQLDGTGTPLGVKTALLVWPTQSSLPSGVPLTAPISIGPRLGHRANQIGGRIGRVLHHLLVRNKAARGHCAGNGRA